MSQRNRLDWPHNIGKRRKITTIDGRVVYLFVKDEIVVPSGDRKLIYFQMLQFEEDDRIEYRFGYYMLGVKPSRRGMWVWGQYCLMLSKEELRGLLQKARSRGWKGL
jgi:hypothetical protein